MKRTLKLVTQVIPMPNVENKYIVQYQFTSTGPIHTDNNDGKGYDLKEAQDACALWWKKSTHG